MNLDQLLDLAAPTAATELDERRAARTARRVRAEYDRRVAAGIDITSDVDLVDPAEMSELSRVQRSAQILKRGWLTWHAGQPAVDWSDEMTRILGYAPGELPMSVYQLFALIHPRDRALVRQRLKAAWRAGEETEALFRVASPDRATRYVHCYLEVFGADGPAGIIATAQDVTEVEKARQERDRRRLRGATVLPDLHEADPVTGLMTRSRFADEVGRALRTGTGMLLVVSAPPYIRRNSDADTGRDDRLNASVAEVLRAVVTPADACGLLDRHEFGVLLPHTDLTTAQPVAEEILDRLRATQFLTASARVDAYGGLVPYDYRMPADSVELLFDAETAWRQAKQYDQPLAVVAEAPTREERRALAKEQIRAAVADDRFALYAQPLRDLELNQTTRFEILLRVLDDVGRAAPPAAFLELAEHVDEILTVDKWVLDRALGLIGQGPQTSVYQINVSGQSLADPQLLEHLREAIVRHRVNPERITIEITETAAIGNLTTARGFADGVRALGCQIALDDFGTGSTPLSFLTQLPVDLLKIDGSFVQDLVRSPALRAIVEGLVETCRRLGILTVAEYVQDDATLDLLRAYGVDFAQGYHVGEPALMVVNQRPPQSIELELRSAL